MMRTVNPIIDFFKSERCLPAEIPVALSFAFLLFVTVPEWDQAGQLQITFTMLQEHKSKVDWILGLVYTQKNNKVMKCVQIIWDGK